MVNLLINEKGNEIQNLYTTQFHSWFVFVKGVHMESSEINM